MKILFRIILLVFLVRVTSTITITKEDDVLKACDVDVDVNPSWRDVARLISKKDWSQANSVSENIPDSICVRAELCVLSEDFTKLKRVLEIDPSSDPPEGVHPQIARRTAEMLRMESHLSAAVKWYEKAVTLKIDSLKSLNVFSSLIECLEELNRIEEARSYFAAAALSRVEFVELQKRYAMFLSSNGRAEEAEQHLLRLSQRYPKVAGYHVALTYVLDRRDDHGDPPSRVLRKITEHLQLALTLSPTLQGIHLRIGKFLMRQNRFTEAVTYLQRAVREYPENKKRIEPISYLAKALVAQGHIKAAIHQYERLLVLSPESVSSHSELAWALLRFGSYSRAESRFHVALRIDPHDTNSLRGLAYTLMTQHQGNDDDTSTRQRIIKAFETLLQHDPRDAQSYVYLSRIIKDRAKKLEYLRRAIQMRPNWAFVHHELAQNLFEGGDTKLAIEHFQEAVRNERANMTNQYIFLPQQTPRLSFLRFRESLGKAYEETNQIKNAIRVYEDATKMYENMNLNSSKCVVVIEDYELYEEMFLRTCRAHLNRPDPERALQCYVRSETLGLEFGRICKSFSFSSSESTNTTAKTKDNNVAVSYYLLGDTENAVHRLLRAESIRPESTIVHQNLAIVLFANGDAEAGLSHLLQAVRLRSRRVDLDDENDIRLTQGVYAEMIRTLMDVSGDVVASIKIWSRSSTVVDEDPSIVSSILRNAFNFLPSSTVGGDDENVKLERDLVLKNVLDSKDDVLFFFDDDPVYVCRNRTNTKCFSFSSGAVVGVNNDTNGTYSRGGHRSRHHYHHHHQRQNSNNNNKTTSSSVFSISASGPCENMSFEQVDDETVSRIMKLGEIMMALSRKHSAIQCFVRVLISTQTESSREFLELMSVLSGEEEKLSSQQEEEETFTARRSYMSDKRRVMGSIARLRLANMFGREKLRASRQLLDRAVDILPNSITTRAVRPPHLLSVLVQAAESHDGVIAMEEEVEDSCTTHNATSLRYRRIAALAFPSSYQILFNLGQALLRQEFYGEAVLQLRASVKLNDRSARAHHACAVALHRTRKYAESLSHFDAAIAIKQDASVHCDRGSVLEDLNRFQLAADAYIRAIDIDPKFERSYLCLGQLLLRDGQLEAAENVYRQLLSNVPNDVNALIALAQIYERQSLVARAARVYELVLKQDPHHVGAAERRVTALQRIGHYGSAENTLESLMLTLKQESESLSTRSDEQQSTRKQQLFREIRRLQDTLLITREKRVATDEALEFLEQSRELALQGQSSVALVHAKAALKIVPSSRQGIVLTAIGELQESLNLMEDADQTYRQALKETPPDPVSQYRLANMMFRENRFAGAAKLLRVLVEERGTKWMDDTNVIDVLRSAQLMLARCYKKLGRIRDAHEQYRNLFVDVDEMDLSTPPFDLSLVSAFKDHTEKDEVLREFNEVSNMIQDTRDMGPSMLESRHPIQAAVAFESALAVNPEDDTSRLGLARAWVASGSHRWDAALDLFRSVDMSRFDAVSLHDYGILLRRSGLHEKALECFQLANKLSPEDPEILHLLGSQLFHLGNTKSAVSALLRAHALQPNRPDILNDLGATYVALGRLKDAEGTFVHALELVPSFEAHVNLGIVLRDQNRIEDAMIHLKKASKLADIFTKSKNVVKDGKIVAREIEVAVEVPERAPRREEHLSVLRILTDLCRNSGDLDCTIDAVAKMCDMMRSIARENPTSSSHAKDLVETLWLHSRMLRKDPTRIREATAVLSEAMLIGQGSIPPFSRIGDIEKEYAILIKSLV